MFIMQQNINETPTWNICQSYAYKLWHLHVSFICIFLANSEFEKLFLSCCESPVNWMTQFGRGKRFLWISQRNRLAIWDKLQCRYCWREISRVENNPRMRVWWLAHPYTELVMGYNINTPLGDLFNRLWPLSPWFQEH